jgi:hypothetical protein
LQDCPPFILSAETPKRQTPRILNVQSYDENSLLLNGAPGMQRRFVLITALVLSISGNASAAAHKCTNAQGRIVYQQHPCADPSTQSVVKFTNSNTGKRKQRAGKRSYKRKKYASRSRSTGSKSYRSSNKKGSQRGRAKPESAKSARAERKRQKMLKGLRCERAKKSLAKRERQNGVEYINMMTGQRLIKNDADARRLIRETRQKVRENC